MPESEIDRSPREWLAAKNGSGRKDRTSEVEGAESEMLKKQKPTQPLTHAAQNRCFGCGAANPSGLRLEFEVSPDGAVACLTEVSGTFDGHPGYLHGGIIATLLDEASSKAVRAIGARTMTRHLEIDYLRPVPSKAGLRLESHVTHHQGRKYWTLASIMDEAGAKLAEAKGLFIEVSKQENGGGTDATPARP